MGDYHVGALVKLTNIQRLSGLLGVHEASIDQLKPTKDNLGWHFPVGRFKFISGADDQVQTTTIKKNQKVKFWPLEDPVPRKYTALVSYDAKLGELGTVSCPPTFAPGEPICMTFTANKQVDIDELGRIFTIYLVD